MHLVVRVCHRPARLLTRDRWGTAVTQTVGKTESEDKYLDEVRSWAYLQRIHKYEVAVYRNSRTEFEPLTREV